MQKRLKNTAPEYYVEDVEASATEEESVWTN